MQIDHSVKESGFQLIYEKYTNASAHLSISYEKQPQVYVGAVFEAYKNSQKTDNADHVYWHSTDFYFVLRMVSLEVHTCLSIMVGKITSLNVLGIKDLPQSLWS